MSDDWRAHLRDRGLRTSLTPKRLLKIVYDKPVKSLDKVKLPYGAEVSRPD